MKTVTRTYVLSVAFDEEQTSPEKVLRELQFHVANTRYLVEPSRPGGKISYLTIDSVTPEKR